MPSWIERHRYREPVVLRDVPQALAGRQIVPAHADAGIDDDSRVRPAASTDERRAVGRHAGGGIDLPADRAGPRVERQQIRRALVIAEQHERPCMHERRAAVSPVDLERAVFRAEMLLPHEPAGHVDRRDLPGPEPRVDALAVGRGARRREVVLLVHERQRRPRPAARTPTRGVPSRDRARSPGTTRCPCRRRPARARARRHRAGCRPARAAAPGGPHRCPPATSRSRRSFQTMGEEMPSPRTGDFQATALVSLHSTGRLRSTDTPDADGPRHVGHCCAWSGAVRAAARMMASRVCACRGPRSGWVRHHRTASRLLMTRRSGGSITTPDCLIGYAVDENAAILALRFASSPRNNAA